MLQDFEIRLHKELKSYLTDKKAVDEHLPECPDVEGFWTKIAIAYMPDGLREYNDYPTAALGWMMYIGMAMAQFWDEDWELYSKNEDIYGYLKDKRGYDEMDEYILDEVLLLKDTERDRVEEIVSRCAARTYHFLSRESIEPGSRDAFDAFISCLRQLYLMGMAVQLKRLGYKMTKLGDDV